MNNAFSLKINNLIAVMLISLPTLVIGMDNQPPLSSPKHNDTRILIMGYCNSRDLKHLRLLSRQFKEDVDKTGRLNKVVANFNWKGCHCLSLDNLTIPQYIPIIFGDRAEQAIRKKDVAFFTIFYSSKKPKFNKKCFLRKTFPVTKKQTPAFVVYENRLFYIASIGEENLLIELYIKSGAIAKYLLLSEFPSSIQETPAIVLKDGKFFESFFENDEIVTLELNDNDGELKQSLDIRDKVAFISDSTIIIKGGKRISPLYFIPELRRLSFDDEYEKPYCFSKAEHGILEYSLCHKEYAPYFLCWEKPIYQPQIYGSDKQNKSLRLIEEIPPIYQSGPFYYNEITIDAAKGIIYFYHTYNEDFLDTIKGIFFLNRGPNDDELPALFLSEHGLEFKCQKYRSHMLDLNNEKGAVEEKLQETPLKGIEFNQNKLHILTPEQVEYFISKNVLGKKIVKSGFLMKADLKKFKFKKPKILTVEEAERTYRESNGGRSFYENIGECSVVKFDKNCNF